jgi:hypothetical protein
MITYYTWLRLVCGECNTNKAKEDQLKKCKKERKRYATFWHFESSGSNSNDFVMYNCRQNGVPRISFLFYPNRWKSGFDKAPEKNPKRSQKAQTFEDLSLFLEQKSSEKSDFTQKNSRELKTYRPLLTPIRIFMCNEGNLPTPIWDIH